MLCGPHCSHLSTILNNMVEPESGGTILFNIVDNCEQCGQQNIVQSCFRQYCNNLIVFSCVKQQRNKMAVNASYANDSPTIIKANIKQYKSRPLSLTDP